MGKEREGSRRKKRGRRRRKERMGNILGWGEKQGKKEENAPHEKVLGVTHALDPKRAVKEAKRQQRLRKNIKKTELKPGRMFYLEASN